MDRAFDVVSKKSSPHPRSSKFSPMLSSRSFIVSLRDMGLWFSFLVMFLSGFDIRVILAS